MVEPAAAMPIKGGATWGATFDQNSAIFGGIYAIWTVFQWHLRLWNSRSALSCGDLQIRIPVRLFPNFNLSQLRGSPRSFVPKLCLGMSLLAICAILAILESVTYVSRTPGKVRPPSRHQS